MQNGGSQSKKQTTSYKNPFEAVKSVGSSVVKNTANEFKNIGTGIFDQIMGNYDYDKEGEFDQHREKPEIKKSPPKKEFKLFNYREYYESDVIKRQIKELTETIKKEIGVLKQADRSLMSEIKDVEKLTFESLPEKPGIYHLRFLEIVLNILRLLRTKIGESKTWLQALISKKKKRGSLFAARSKSKGTQYSLSQELQLTRQTG